MKVFREHNLLFHRGSCRATALAQKWLPPRSASCTPWHKIGRRFNTVEHPQKRNIFWTQAWPARRDARGLPLGRCHPVRRDGLAARARSRRHRDHSPARPALRAGDLYAGVRPIRTFAGLPGPLSSHTPPTSIWCWCARAPKAFFARGRGHIEGEGDARAAYDTMKITHAGTARVCDFVLRLARQRKAQRQARPGHQRRQRQTSSRQWLSGARRLRNAPRLGQMGDRQRLCRRDGAESGDETLGLRRSGHRKHVRRHPVGSDRRAGRWYGHGAVGRHRRPICTLPVRPRHRAWTSLARGIANPTATLLSATMMLDWLAHRQ